MVADRFLNEIYRELMILASSESHYPYIYKMVPSDREPAVEEKRDQIKHLPLAQAEYVANEFELSVMHAVAAKWLAA